MRAGKLRNRVALQTKTVTYNSYHEPLEAWATARYLWAEAIPSGSKEFFAAQQKYTETSLVLVVRDERDATVTVANRVVLDSRTYEILGIDTDGGYSRLCRLYCKEVV